MINYLSNEPVMIIHLVTGVIKHILLNRMSYFRESFDFTLNKIRDELNLTNYAPKSDLKKAKSTDT